MTTLIDILGATAIGLTITLMILNFNLSSSGYKVQSDLDLQVIQNAQNLADLLNHDLRKIGFRVKDTNKVLIAELRRISFRADIDSNGTIDTVTYSLSDSTSLSATENPRDKILYRKVNSSIIRGESYGLTELLFTYRDKFGNITTNLRAIKSIKAEVWIQSLFPYEGRYAGTYWELTISPRNL